MDKRPRRRVDRLRAVLAVTTLCLVTSGCKTSPERTPDKERGSDMEQVETPAKVDRPQEVDTRQEERTAMVQRQLRARDITDPRVLAAMEKVPRHRFIPPEGQDLAYEDHPVSIGHRQTISQPYIVAYMTQALSPKPNQRVLEIGTGSGYQAAVLSEVVGEVYTIEIVAPLGERARATLEALGHDNISFRIGDGYAGWPEAAPFDAIMLTAAPPEIPKPLLDQLAVGGVMIAPVGRGHQELIKIHRTPDGFVPKSVMGVRFVPMTGRAQQD